MTLGCCYLYFKLPLSVISGGMCMGRDRPRHSLLGVVLMKEKDLLRNDHGVLFFIFGFASGSTWASCQKVPETLQ